MKNIWILAIILVFTMCGCSDLSAPSSMDINMAYESGYQEGYESGYNDAYEKKLAETDYIDDIHSFQIAIAELMYDHEYDVVRKILDYNPEGVLAALELEFGTKDINVIIAYLEERAQTIIGSCEICGETVYADEAGILPEGVQCAHVKCVGNNEDNSTPQINRDK